MGNGCSCMGKASFDMGGKFKGETEMAIHIPPHQKYDEPDVEDIEEEFEEDKDE